jgi:hypothetical protein
MMYQIRCEGIYFKFDLLSVSVNDIDEQVNISYNEVNQIIGNICLDKVYEEGDSA